MSLIDTGETGRHHGKGNMHDEVHMMVACRRLCVVTERPQNISERPKTFASHIQKVGTCIFSDCLESGDRLDLSQLHCQRDENVILRRSNGTRDVPGVGSHNH